MTKQDYYTITKKDGVATIWLDQKGEKVNKVGPEVVGLFEDLADSLENDPEVKAAVLISKKKDFIAGADIDSFLEVKKPGDWKPITQKGHQILDRMANSKIPVVAAIHGAALGAGLEIALACAGRVASSDPSTKMAFPEVQLGILPGGAGTQRAPRLVGLQKALDMMLTGRNIFSVPAKKMGLVDELVHPSKLHQAASKLALRIAEGKFKRKRKQKLLDKFLDGTALGRSIVIRTARKKTQAMTKGNYPAVPRIIDCVETGLKKGMKVGLEAEATKFEELLLTKASRALISLFFGMTDKKKNPYSDKAKKIDYLAMVGAGFMGAGITEVSITKDIDVLLKDIKDETITSAKKLIWKSLKKKVRRKALRKTQAEEIMGNVKGQLDYSDFDNVDIIIEAVFEAVGLKQKVLAECEAVTHDKCIFASNTSALPIGKIAAKAKRPELVIGMHYFSPVPKMPLLEIVKTPKTADWVVASCFELGIRQGKTCIVVNDAPGFYTTRILAAFMNEALLMLEEGADALQLDSAMKKWGFPVGPITLMDEVGIDVGAHIAKGDITEAFMQREGAKSTDVMVKLFEAGFHGRKNKKGFFQYDSKTGKKKRGQINNEVYQFFGGSSRKKLEDEYIQNRLGFTMINEAVRCLEDGVLESAQDGDIGAVFGLGFPPFTGGPFLHLDTIGADKAVAILNSLKEKYGARFNPCNLLQEKAKSGEKFRNF
ncbi:MAG: 3-hydroxyacyl-CoA dehydrogenase NAD-binding domain-containing protein [Bacteroidota bacterium]